MRLEKFINISWYMSYKPYTKNSDYDLFYLNICRDLFKIVSGLADKHAQTLPLEKEDCRELAYIFTAYITPWFVSHEPF